MSEYIKQFMDEDGTITADARAKALHEGRPEDAVDLTMINNTKIGLMGPLAGIGDAIDSGTI